MDDKRLAAFLWAAFWGLCAVSTVVLFMSVYAKQAIGLGDEELHRLLMTATAVTIAGSFFWGWITDRLGGFWTLWWVWGIWTLVLVGASFSFHPGLFWILGSLAGVALAGTWVASRVLLVEVVGPARIGEAFGLFGLVSRLSAVVGPVVWGLVLWAGTSWGIYRYRLGMASLLLFTLVGWYLYHRLRGKLSI